MTRTKTLIHYYCDQDDVCVDVQFIIAVVNFTFRPRCTNVVHDLGSAEPSTSVIGDLNRVQVALHCSNMNSVHLTVDQLIHNLNRGYI